MVLMDFQHITSRMYCQIANNNIGNIDYKLSLVKEKQTMFIHSKRKEKNRNYKVNKLRWYDNGWFAPTISS